EDNTKPDGFADFWGAVAGPKRAWFGRWDNVRGNGTDENGGLKMGGAGWFDEVMRFYDLHLKGIQPSIVDPPVAVESSDGHWRAEDAWPPADAGTVTATLRTGSYLDQPLTFSGTGSEDTGQTLWTFSPQLPYDAHLAGTPRATLDLSALLPGANVVADVY